MHAQFEGPLQSQRRAAEFPEIENLLTNLSNKVNLTALFNNKYQRRIIDLSV